MDIISTDKLFEKVPELRNVNLDLCLDCKSVKLACGLPRCPLTKLYDIPKPDVEKIETISGNSVFGPSPQIFVGDRGYPTVFSGPLTSLNPDSELANLAAKPNLWTSLDLSQIIELRFGLLRGMKRTPVFPQKIKTLDQRIVDGIQEIALSTVPVDIESTFEGQINPTITVDSILTPQGPTGALKKMDVVGNVKAPEFVERTLDDELLASEQIGELARRGIDVYYLQNVFSAGLTGKTNKQKLVPTRWSITAVDDTVGKQLISDLKDFRTVDDITLFHGGFFGNYFTFILFPGDWIFENFENWMKGTIYTIGRGNYIISQDHEGFKKAERYKGKVGYSRQAGGYYAARLSVLQYLHRIKRQAKVISIREITSEYLIPSGVWVVREAARVSLETKPVVFSTEEEMKEYTRNILLTPIEEYYRRSEVLAQSTLDSFFD